MQITEPMGRRGAFRIINTFTIFASALPTEKCRPDGINCRRPAMQWPNAETKSICFKGVEQRKALKLL
jgi:hypothetical protein